jgi:predicted RND superfamily exporter protein
MTYIQQNIASSFEFVQQLVRARRGMLQRAIVTTVDFCTRYAVQIIGIAVLLGLACGIYAADHFAIDTDVNKLISQSLAWRQREAAFNNSFPGRKKPSWPSSTLQPPNWQRRPRRR